MGEVYSIDAAHITTIRDGTVELTQMAEMGAEGTGTFTLDDAAGTQQVVGHKDVAVTQSSCANTHTYGGFVDDREWARYQGRERDTGASRGIIVNVLDLNNYLNQHGLSSAAYRPAETCAARLEWLVGSAFWPPAVTVGSRASAPATVGMDIADYTDQFTGDVLADIALAAGGLNYYVADWGSGPELTLRNDNTSTADSSAVRISNVLADVDSGPETLGAAKTFAPSGDFKLNRSPREVYSRMSYSYAQGRTTGETPVDPWPFGGTRFGTASDSNIKNLATATLRLNELLWVHSTERDFLEGSITVPSSAVNLLRHGERCEVKFSHMGSTGGRDYDDWTWCRVMERTVVPLTADGGIYELRLRLSPQEEAAPAAGIIQSAFGGTGEGGDTLDFPNPVTIDSLLVFCASDRTGENPTYPNTGTDHPRFGPGAWTLLNTGTVRNRATSDGIAFWAKVADATDQYGFVAMTNAQCGVWEIACPDAAATLAAITVIDETDQMNALLSAQTLSTGSVGTLAAGSIALYCTNWADQTNEGESRPEATMAAGWTRRRFEPAYISGGPIIDQTPYTVIADATGTGVAVTAAVTRSLLHREFGTYWGSWCGMAVKVVPQ